MAKKPPLDDAVVTPAPGITVQTDDAGAVKIVQSAEADKGTDCVITVPKDAAQSVAYAVLRAASEADAPPK